MFKPRPCFISPCFNGSQEVFQRLRQQEQLEKRVAWDGRCFYGQVDEFSNWWLAVTNVKLGSPLILQETEETPILLVQKTPEIFSHGRNGVKMPPLPEVLERYEYQRKEAEILRRQSQVGTDPSGFPFCCTQSPWVSTGFQSSCLTESHNFHIKHFHPKKSSNLDFCYHGF